MIPASDFEINDDLVGRLLAPFKDLLKAEREIIVGPDDARRSELRSLIEEREAELRDDRALGVLFDKYINTLPEAERPQGRVQESHALVGWVGNLRAELADWRVELEELESRPVDKAAVFNSARSKAMYLLRRVESLLNPPGSTDKGKPGDDESARLLKLSKMSVNEIGFSNRIVNCLNNANITTVGELAKKSEADMLRYRNFGKKSLDEIKEKLQSLGLKLGDAREDPSLAETTSTEGEDLQAGKRKKLEDLKDKRDEALDREDRGQDCGHWYNLSQLGKTVSITGSRHPINLGFPNGVKSVYSRTWKEMYESVVKWLVDEKLLLPNDIPWKLKNYFWGKNLNTRLGSKDIVFRSRRFIRACGEDPAQFEVQLR